MKRHILIIFLIQLAFFSCKKSEVDPLFDQSANQRVITAINKYKDQLTNPQYGWKASYYPNGAKDGGYSFYLKFDKNGNLTMYSDVDAQFTDNAFETTYQVKNLQKPTIIFDTYSYLHELVNPDYNGGTGANADLELTIKEASDNKITLLGNRNSTEMVLTALNATEYASLTKGGLGNIYRSTVNYISSDKFLNLQFPSGENSDIVIDLNSKIFTIVYVQNNDIATANTAFYTTTTGITFKNPITLFGVTIPELIWDDAAKSYYFLNGSKKVNLTESKRPALPFYYALGSLFTDVVFDVKIPTQSAAYKQMYTDIKAKVAALSTTAPVRVLGDVYLKYLPDDGVFALVFEYTRTYPDRVDAFGGVLFYEPSLDSQGNIIFSRLDQTATLAGGQLFQDISPIVNEGVKAFTDVLEKNIFTWDYDTVETRTAVLRAVKAPNFMVKGTLY
jgi:Domain of unknown function (DUF4302)